jgi:hypothetical protein
MSAVNYKIDACYRSRLGEAVEVEAKHWVLWARVGYFRFPVS